jgi:SnoaL-like domain
MPNGSRRAGADLMELVAIEKIKQLKARSFRYLDARAWDVLGDVFTADAVAGRDSTAVHGRDAIVEHIRSVADVAKTVHHGFLPEIVVLGPDRAEGVWAMQDYFEEREGDRPKGFIGAGHYHETYALDRGVWRISTMVLTRLRIEALPGGLPEFFQRV